MGQIHGEPLIALWRRYLISPTVEVGDPSIVNWRSDFLGPANAGSVYKSGLL